jgi:hypothetical protein
MNALEIARKTLEEKKANAEKAFEALVKQRVDNIITIQKRLASDQKALADEQKKLREMKLEHEDHSALFQE